MTDFFLHSRRLLCLMTVGASLACGPLVSLSAADNQGDSETETSALIKVPKLGTHPLAVVTLSSLDQARTKLRALCDIAGRPEAADDIINSIDEATDTLAGVEKTRPGGLAIYLDSVFPPAFEFIAFAPLSDVDRFMTTLERGPVISSPVPGDSSRFELLGPTNTSQVRVENGYAFIQLPIMDPDEDFDRPLFDPVTHHSNITGQYDISVTLDVASIPRVTRNLLLSFVTSTMSTQMQQRDEEADGLYEMRRAWMQGDIDSLKLLLDECQRVSIGVSVAPEIRAARVDLLMDVREGSDLLNELFESTTRASYFTPILNDDSAVSISLSQLLPDRDRERYIGVLDGFKKELARQVTLKDLGPELDDSSPVLAGLTALQETVSEGHLDLFAQCYGDSENNLVVVGALRVQDGETVAAATMEMLNRLQNQDGLENLQIDFGQHSGIQFHRIGFDDADAGRDAVLGPDSGFVFGSGPRSIWFGLGGQETLDIIGNVMTQLTEAYEQPSQTRHSSNLRIIVNVEQLIQLSEAAGNATSAAAATEDTSAGTSIQPDGENENQTPATGRGRRRQRAAATVASWRQTFAEGGDRIRVDYEPTNSGARLRLEFGEAFLKGIGRGIAIGRSGTNK